MRFTDLPSDIIDSFCSHVLPEQPLEKFKPVANLSAVMFPSSLTLLHPLDALSRTCRAVRVVCMPWMFGTMYIHHRSSRDFIPPSGIWSFVRTIFFAGLELNERLVDIKAMLSQMPILTRIVCDGVDMGVSKTAHLDAFFSAPFLEELTILDICLTGYHVTTAPHLRAFNMAFYDRLNGPVFDMPGSKLWTEFESLTALLDPLRSQLETLRIPGETMCLSFLASAPWPRLTDFTMSGACPILDTSLSHVLNMMPQLRSFTFAVAPYKTAPPFTLWPANAAYQPWITNLKRLVISFPDPNDHVFSHLPSSLSELALRDTPRYFTGSDRAHYQTHPTITRCKAPLLTCAAALCIFSTCSAENISSLELVVEEDSYELNMLALITVRFPRLTFLEYHRYRVRHSSPENNVMIVPVNLLFSALANYKSLRHLRLNLDAPVTYGMATASLRGGGIEHAESQRWVAEQAETAVVHMPWLETVSFFIPVRRSWRLYDVIRTDSGSLTVLQSRYSSDASYEPSWV